jgi:hypothetical protein
LLDRVIVVPPVLHQEGAGLIEVNLGEVLEEAEDRCLPPLLLLQLSHGLCEVPPLGLEYLACLIDRQTRLGDQCSHHLALLLPGFLFGLEASLVVLRPPECLGFVNLVNLTLHVGLLFDLDLLEHFLKA